MHRSQSADEDQFSANSIEDVFALYLSRELDDLVRVRFYVRLTSRYSMCLLVNALRMARRTAGREKVRPEEFLRAVDRVAEEGISA